MEAYLTIGLFVMSIFGVTFSSYYIYERINEHKKTPFK